MAEQKYVLAIDKFGRVVGWSACDGSDSHEALTKEWNAIGRITVPCTAAAVDKFYVNPLPLKSLEPMPAADRFALAARIAAFSAESEADRAE